MSEQYTPNIGQLDKTISNNKKKFDLILLVDTNNKINGEIVNEKIEEIISSFKQLQVDELKDCELVISIITFAEKADCKVEQTKIIDYVYKPIIFDGIRKSYSNAYGLLNDKLTRKKFMAHTGKIAQPCILLMTDGESTSDDNYVSKLDLLLRNGWFFNSQRLAVLIGENAFNSASARRAVGKFVSDTDEGIIEINEIASVVKYCCPRHIGPGVHIPIHTASDIENINAVKFDSLDETYTDIGFNGFGGFDGFIDESEWI